MGALQFDADGFLLLSESLAGLSSGQASRGKCWFGGSLLTLVDADGSGEGSYAVELRSTKEGRPVPLKQRAVDGPFVDRREILTKRVWIWVEPWVRRAESPGQRVFRVTDPFELREGWLAAGL